MGKTIKTLTAILFAVTVLSTGCKKDETPDDPNQPLINQMK